MLNKAINCLGIKVCSKTIKKSVRTKHRIFRIVIIIEERGTERMELGKVKRGFQIMKNMHF